MFSYGFCEIIKNIFFTDHLQAIAANNNFEIKS